MLKKKILFAGSKGASKRSSAPSSSNVKRRVSRVESLRNLFFNRGGGGSGANAVSGPDARKGFLAKKRARSAEKEKVDKAIGTDSGEDTNYTTTVAIFEPRSRD